MEGIKENKFRICNINLNENKIIFRTIQHSWLSTKKIDVIVNLCDEVIRVMKYEFNRYRIPNGTFLLNYYGDSKFSKSTFEKTFDDILKYGDIVHIYESHDMYIFVPYLFYHEKPWKCLSKCPNDQKDNDCWYCGEQYMDPLY